MTRCAQWKWKTVSWVIAASMAASGMAATPGAETSAPSLFKMKAGACAFKLLDSNGVKPLVDSTLALASVEDGQCIAKTKSDKTGTCALAIVAGRYILQVNDRNLAILEASDKETISECRIVVPETADLQVGAGEKNEQEAAGNTLLSRVPLKPVIIGGAVILTAAGGWAIYEHNDNDDDGDGAGDGFVGGGDAPAGGGGDVPAPHPHPPLSR